MKSVFRSAPVVTLTFLFALLVVVAVLLGMGVIWALDRLQEWQLKRCLKHIEPGAVVMPFPRSCSGPEFAQFWAQFVEWAKESNIKIINIDSFVVRPLPKVGRYVIVKSIPIGDISPAFMLFLTKSDAVMYKLAFAG
jgi:hypothetical protein